MNWRQWALGRILASQDVMNELPQPTPHDYVFGAGSLTEAPNVGPFIVIRLGPTVKPGGVPVDETELTLFVHDFAESYVRITNVLKLLRDVIEVDIPEEGGIAAVWQGDSADLGDDAYDTLMRNSTYRLLERRA